MTQIISSTSLLPYKIETGVKHYETGMIDFVFVIEDWKLNFNLGNVLKYLNRAGKKPGEPKSVALRKALFYLTRELSLCEKEEGEQCEAVYPQGRFIS